MLDPQKTRVIAKAAADARRELERLGRPSGDFEYEAASVQFAPEELGPVAREILACLVTAGELIGCTYDSWPIIQRWLGRMKKLQSWPKVNEAMYGFAGSLREKKFQTV